MSGLPVDQDSSGGEAGRASMRSWDMAESMLLTDVLPKLAVELEQELNTVHHSEKSGCTLLLLPESVVAVSFEIRERTRSALSRKLIPAWVVSAFSRQVGLLPDYPSRHQSEDSQVRTASPSERRP